MTRPTTRDLRIDVVRGLALAMIFVDHIPGNVFARFTLQAVGFNDAAEVFVFLAGLSSAMAYASTFDRAGLAAASRKVFARVTMLYVVHVALFVLVAGMMALAARVSGDPAYLEVIAATAFETEPLTALVRLVTLTFQPTYLDILPLYVVLLSAVPLLVLASKVHLLLPLAGSIGLFALGQIEGMNLPNYPTTPVWFFNPLAWQLVFVLGFTLGMAGRAGHALPKLPLVTALAVLVVVAGAIAAAPWRALPGLADAVIVPPELLPALDKTNLAWPRLLNLLAQAWLVAVLVPRDARWLGTGAGALLGIAGRKSLEVFSLGILLSFAGMIVLTEFGHDLMLQAAVTASGIGIMLATAYMLDRRDRSTRARASVAVGVAERAT